MALRSHCNRGCASLPVPLISAGLSLKIPDYTPRMEPEQPSMVDLQEVAYGADRDYTFGSPHLAHPSLRNRIERELAAIVHDQIRGRGECAVLEIGAGHGTFTQALLDAGAHVTVTEMSEPSAVYLRRRYTDHPGITVVHDPTATGVRSWPPSTTSSR